MRLDSAIKLVAQFPTVSYFTWSGAKLEIEPNPFAWRRGSWQESTSKDIVRRLMQSRKRPDRPANERSPWWQRLTRRLTRTAA
jgi:hypothetical protein